MSDHSDRIDQVEQPVVARTIQQQSSATLPRAAPLEETVASSVEHPVVAATIQQQLSSTAERAETEFSTVVSSVEQPVVPRMIQQQLSDGAAALSPKLATLSVEQPVVANTIQQQSFVLMVITPLWIGKNLPIERRSKNSHIFLLFLTLYQLS